MVFFFNCNDSLPPYQCSDCDFSTNEKTNQMHHNCEIISKSEVMFKLCGLCSIGSFSQLWAFSHQIKHKNQKNSMINYKSFDCHPEKIIKKSECDQCNYIGRCSYDLRLHIISRHEPADKIVWYKCEDCSLQYKLKTHLNQHIKRVHLKNDSNENQTKIKCTKCMYWTYRSCDMKKHNLYKHNFSSNWNSCRMCNYKIILLKNLQNHIEARHCAPDQKYKCHTCCLQFKSYDSLKYHKILRHSKKSAFQCRDCTFCTTSVNSLEKHNKRKHTITLLECKNCDYTTSDLLSFRKHTKKEHPFVDKNYKCLECSFSSNFKKSLRSHMKLMHTPDNELIWFSCEICKYKSKRRGDLKTHMISVHSIGSGFKCKDCSFSTPTSNRLKQHIINKHTPDDLIKWYNCKHCSYTTKSAVNFRRHKNHKNE